MYQIKVVQRSKKERKITSWNVWRRYNDFDEVHKILDDKEEFPSRSFLTSSTAKTLMEERRQKFKKWICILPKIMESLRTIASRKRRDKLVKVLCTFLWEDRKDLSTEYLKIDLPPGIPDEKDRKIDELESRLKRMSGQLETAHNDLRIRTEREQRREEEMMKRNDPMKFEFDDADGENEEGTIESVNREILKLTGMLQGNKDRLSAEAISARDRADDAETMYKKMLKQLREEMSMEREKWAKERRRLTMSLQEAKKEILASKVRRQSSVEDLIKERDILLNTPRRSRNRTASTSCSS